MKTVTRLISSAVIVLILTVLVAFAKAVAPVFIPLWQPFSQSLLTQIAVVTGVVSFPIWEAIALLFAVWFIATLAHAIKHLKLLRWLSGFVWGVCIAVFLFVGIWGVGHFLPSKTEQIVTVREFSVPELREAALYYGEQAGKLSQLVPRDADGAPSSSDWAHLNEMANAAFSKLSEQYPLFSYEQTNVKPLIPGMLFQYLGTTGIFVPFTAEASVSPETYAAALPYTFCHELAHRFGANAEEDANFCAFLACDASDDPSFRYSANYSALLYCYRALREQDETLAAELWNKLSPQLQADILGGDAHYAPYQGAVRDAAQKVNDAYLKAFEQQGVRSYGLVSDALIAWYQSNRQKTGN